MKEKPVTPGALVSDLSSLVKSLQGLKAIQLRYVEAKVFKNDGVKVALVDGGATHALRRGTKSELENSEQVIVKLAHGSMVLRKKKGCSTPLTSDDIKRTLPVRLLIDHGFNLTWTSSGINIHHPRRGALRCWKRQGCPVMHREEALALMKELEELEVNSAVDDDVIAWWSERYPNVPKEVLKFMVGQNDKWEDLDHGGLPFNRHRRRQLETCRGAVLHLYAGGEHQSKKWQCRQRAGFEVLALDVALGANHNLHGRQLYAYRCTSREMWSNKGGVGRSALPHFQPVTASTAGTKTSTMKRGGDLKISPMRRWRRPTEIQLWS